MFSKYNPEIHHRHSIRLPEYDYSDFGIYFVTICTYQRERVFGEILNRKMVLNNDGKIAEQYWLDIPNRFAHVELDKYVIMPNHVHGIIKIVRDFGNVGAQCDVGAQRVVPLHCAPLRKNKFQHILPGSLGVIVRNYKSIITKLCRKNNDEYIIWQRNYHERIIRTDRELNNVRQYILNNPANWQNDRNNIEFT